MHLLGIDDAAVISQLLYHHELSVMDEVLCNTRKGALHLMLTTQIPEVLSPGIVANCANKIVFRLDSGAGIEAMQQHMGITEPSQREYFYKLKQQEREVIVEFARRSRPFVAKILNVNPPRKMNEQELQENNKRLLRGFSQVVPRTKPPDPGGTVKAPDAEGLTSDEKEFLEASYHCWDSKLTDLYARLGWKSVQRGDETVAKLEKLGYIIRVRLNPSGKQGGQSAFVFHTEKYYSLSGKTRPIVGTDGKGPEHATLIRFIHKKVKSEKGCSDIEISRPFEGTRTDLYYRYGDAGYCVEAVSTTLKTEASKIIKLLQHPDVKTVFVVADKAELVKALKKELKELERAVVLKLSEFLNQDMGQLLNEEG